MIEIAIADDQELVRSGIRMILEGEPDMRVAGEAADGQQAFDLVQRVPVDVLLMDVRMPGEDGISATSRILAQPCPTPGAHAHHLRPGRIRLRCAARRCGLRITRLRRIRAVVLGLIHALRHTGVASQLRTSAAFQARRPRLAATAIDLPGWTLARLTGIEPA